jgi:hypothetical protein
MIPSPGVGISGFEPLAPGPPDQCSDQTELYPVRTDVGIRTLRHLILSQAARPSACVGMFIDQRSGYL